MHEFTIRIETPEGSTTDERKAALVEAAIETNGEVGATTTIFDSHAGTIASTFQVKAPTLEEAQDIGLRVFTAALLRASISSERGWLVIEAGGP